VTARNVLRVFSKELKETLRDRRTIIVMVIVPVFLYPVLLVVVEQLAIFGQRRIEEVQVLVAVSAPVGPRDFLEADSAIVVVPATETAEDEVVAGSLDALVAIDPETEESSTTAIARIVFDSSRDRSRRAHEVVTRRLGELNDTLLARRLAERGLPRSFAEPLQVSDSSVASPEQLGGYALGRFLPLLLMMMTLLGAFFPAIDLTAGEKERGTLETLLTSPLPNRDIIAGKFGAVVVVAIAAAALNLGSMLLTFQSGIFQLTRSMDLHFELPAVTVALVLLFLIPLAVLFAALFMGIAVRAQSFKEAQNSLTPVQFAAILPMYLPLIPGIPFSYATAMIPVGGIGLLFREMMGGRAPLGPAVLAVAFTVLYASVALRFAAAAFGKEEVLFGSGTEGATPVRFRERLASWRAGARTVPRAGEALLVVGIVALLYFYLGVRLQVLDVERGLFASQWLLLALPAVTFVAIGPYRVRETFALRRAEPRAFAAALLIVVGGIPVGWALGWLQAFFIEIPEEFLVAFENLLTADSPARMAWLLLAVAVTPAICEELVFRGVLLQGLSSGSTARRAVIGSALVFGAFHLSFETVIRFLPTAWLGLLFGLVVWRTRSIFPSMLMHFVNNATVLVLVANTGLQSYLTGPSGEPRWLAVGAGVFVLAAGLRLLPLRAPTNVQGKTFTQ
jgi:sodium transport system permease protein